MNNEKIEIRRKKQFFVVLGVCIPKTIDTKIKITCIVFCTEKTAPVLPKILFVQ